MHIFLCPKDDSEVNAEVTEGVVANKGFKLLHASLHFLKDFFSHLDCHPLHLFQIALIAYTHLDKDRQLRFGKIKVCDLTAHQFDIGDDDEVIGEHPDPCVSPSDLGYIALLPRFEHDVISYPNGLVNKDVNSRKEVGKASAFPTPPPEKS